MRAQLVAGRQVEPGEHHDLVARSQVLGALRDLLIEADPRPRRAFALVRRIVEDAQGRLHPPDRHEAVARLHKNSLSSAAGTAHAAAQIDPYARVVTVERATRNPHLSAGTRAAFVGGVYRMRAISVHRCRGFALLRAMSSFRSGSHRPSPESLFRGFEPAGGGVARVARQESLTL